MSTLGGKARYLGLAGIVVVLDQWSKWWIELNLDYHEIVRVLPGLNLTRLENTGIAFGLLPARGSAWGTALLMLLGLAALFVVGVFFLRARRAERWLLTGLGLVLGGAVGNLIDRALAGAVTDFIDVYVGTYHWHTFNVADSAITCGIVLLLLESFFGRHAPDREPTSGEAD